LFVYHVNPQKEAFTLNVDMNMEEIFAKVLWRFGLSLRNSEDFVLKIPTLGYYIKSYEHFRENQSLIFQTKKKKKSHLFNHRKTLSFITKKLKRSLKVQKLWKLSHLSLNQKKII